MDALADDLGGIVPALLILVGLVGIVVPILPGLLLILAGVKQPVLVLGRHRPERGPELRLGRRAVGLLQGGDRVSERRAPPRSSRPAPAITIRSARSSNGLKDGPALTSPRPGFPSCPTISAWSVPATASGGSPTI